MSLYAILPVVISLTEKVTIETVKRGRDGCANNLRANWQLSNLTHQNAKEQALKQKLTVVSLDTNTNSSHLSNIDNSSLKSARRSVKIPAINGHKNITFACTYTDMPPYIYHSSMPNWIYSRH